MNESIANYFSRTVSDYDTVCSHVVMKNDELHGELIRTIQLSVSEPSRILDLGCGTGHGMALMLQAFSNAKVTGVDISPKMLAQCRARLEMHQGRFELIEGDFCTVDLAGPYDVIVSAIALHNIADEKKVELFHRVFETLIPGGVFANGDFIKCEDTFMQQQTDMLYRDYVRSRLAGEELDVWLRHIEEDDVPMKLSEQFDALEKLGFTPPSLSWLYVNEAVFFARKPLESEGRLQCNVLALRA